MTLVESWQSAGRNDRLSLVDSKDFAKFLNEETLWGRERLLLQESHARAEAQVRRLEEHIRRLQEKNNPEVDLLNDMDDLGADWWKKGPVEE